MVIHTSYAHMCELITSTSGYGCGDHFLETDLYLHCWQVLAELLQVPEAKDVICDIGM